jgi:exopolysaccharide/PEP-CTERM locus tyrosine autokinase
MSSLIEQAALRLEQLRHAGACKPAAKPVAPTVGTEATVASPLESTKDVATETKWVDKPSAGKSRRVEINPETLAAAGIVSPQAPRSQIADQFRVIKRPLIKNAMGKGASVIANGNLIMVTSSVQGEGKTFTAINLAMSMATELDTTVMLVDADVARPSVMKMLGLPPSPGLLDLVLDETKSLSGMLLKTNIAKLTILPSGTPHSRATELLASDAMVRLVEDISARYSDRIIVFDSPPLLMTTESRVLATHMGQIVFVVHAEKTLQSEVRQALATIESCPVKLMLLNKASALFKGGYGYGYGYGYGGGYGYGHEQAKA